MCLACVSFVPRGRAVLRFGKGAQQADLGDSDNVLADAVEALIAAVYFEHGQQAAWEVCRQVLEFGLAKVGEAGARDAKSTLQEKVQALGHKPPVYRVIERLGPAHETVFRVAVCLGDSTLATGEGR